MSWFSRKPSWERQYAENIYDGLVGGKKLGDITPERLRIPLMSYRRYEEKDLLLRELTAFMALMVAADKDKAPELLPVLGEFGRLLVSKLAARGINVDMDHLAETTMDDVSAMLADPFPWAQRWLAEFRDDPKDNYMVALFADHCVKQYSAYEQAIESTRPK
jgi:hypothetical protein